MILCCLSAACSSFQFGYGIASLNSPTKIIKMFIKDEFFLFNTYHKQRTLFLVSEQWLEGNETFFKNSVLEMETKKSDYAYCRLWGDEECVKRIEEFRDAKAAEIKRKHNKTTDEYLAFANATLIEKRALLESKRPLLVAGEAKVNKVVDIIWTTINCLFVVGGLVGAFTSKYVLDWFGRKNSILFHNLFSVIAAILAFLAPSLKYPTFVMINRFLVGLQGSMSCT